jgi:hypothetical protein
MKKQTRLVTVKLQVEVPKFLTSMQVKREIRSRINDEVGYYDQLFIDGELEEVNVKVKKILPVKRPKPFGYISLGTHFYISTKREAIDKAISRERLMSSDIPVFLGESKP